ncbi:MAG: chemotaxis protein CheW [Chlamydiia bacterium]|nr:chemotaxis protein CheW [Chlamydiia bacterium]
MLIFYSGDERFACKAEDVLEIIPLVALKKIQSSHKCLIGSVNYGGLLVPVLDWGLLQMERPSQRNLHTRIIFIPHPDMESDIPYLGILAERVTTTLEADPSRFISSPVALKENPYFSGVMTDAVGTIELVDLKVLARLFAEQLKKQEV